MSSKEEVQLLSQALQDALLEFSPESMVTAKRMFGGAGFYVDGYFMAASFEAGTLALKLHPSDREELLTIPGTARTMSDQYVNIPLPWLDDPVELAVWVSKSLSYVRSLPQRKRR